MRLECLSLEQEEERMKIEITKKLEAVSIQSVSESDHGLDVSKVLLSVILNLTSNLDIFNKITHKIFYHFLQLFHKNWCVTQHVDFST